MSTGLYELGLPQDGARGSGLAGSLAEKKGVRKYNRNGTKDHVP